MIVILTQKPFIFSIRFGDNVKILHFIGQLKPWVINFDPVAKKPNPPQEYKHLTEYLDLWWNIFCGEIHPKLVTDMVSHCIFIFKIIIFNLLIFFITWDLFPEFANRLICTFFFFWISQSLMICVFCVNFFFSALTSLSVHSKHIIISLIP